MKIGILGSGLMGAKLGTIFARAGHEVVFSYARKKQKLERLARDAGKTAQRSGDTRDSRPGCVPSAPAKSPDSAFRSML